KPVHVIPDHLLDVVRGLADKDELPVTVAQALALTDVEASFNEHLPGNSLELVGSIARAVKSTGWHIDYVAKQVEAQDADPPAQLQNLRTFHKCAFDTSKWKSIQNEMSKNGKNKKAVAAWPKKRCQHLMWSRAIAKLQKDHKDWTQLQCIQSLWV